MSNNPFTDPKGQPIVYVREVTPEELHRVVRHHLGDLEAVARELEHAARRLVREAGDPPAGG